MSKKEFPLNKLDFASDHSPIHNIAAVMLRSYSDTIAQKFVQPIDDHEKIENIKEFLTNILNNQPQTDPQVWGHIIDSGSFRGKIIIAYIPVTWPDICESTQRINDKDEKKFCNEEMFKDHLSGQVTLNYRDGRLFIMDGKHRLIGFIFNGVMYIQVKIFVGDKILNDGLTKQEEAMFFATQGDHVSNPSEYQKYEKGLEAQLRDCMSVHILADQFNLVPSEGKKDHGTYTLHSLNTIRDIVVQCEKSGIQNMPFWMMDILKRSNWFTNNTEPPLTSRLMKAFYTAYKTQLKASGGADIMADRAVKVLVKLDYEKLNLYATKHAGKKDHRNGWQTTLNNIVMGTLTAEMILNAINNDAQTIPEQPATVI